MSFRGSIHGDAEWENISAMMQTHTQKAAQRVARVVEEACERAIQGGEYGVLILRNDDGTMHVGVSELVPYGRIADMPASAVFDWIESGCPM
jgi:hypothetical protein